MLGSFIRRVGFWFLDMLKGGVTRKHYNDIKCVFDSGKPNLQPLSELLEHAVETSVFYQSFDPSNIYSFPVINKNIVRDNYDAIFSKTFKGKPLHKVSTSGSTGTPFVLSWNISKRKRQLADLIYFNECAGLMLGDPYMYFRVWTNSNKKSTRERIMQNMTPVDIRNLDDETFEFIRKKLKNGSTTACIGYASTYEFFTKYLQDMGDSPSMFRTKVFITSSEVMTPETKALIKKTVGCEIADRYSNEENGFLAQSIGCDGDFLVNYASFLIEILREDSDEPVKVGEVGRVVVTDLFSRAMPLIRYDTGDLAIKAEEKDGFTTKIKNIQGRRADVIYNANGDKLTSHAFGVYMKDFDKLKQYQIIQNGPRNYTLLLNGSKGVYDDELVIESVKQLLGKNADITIEHTNSIPTLASGKFKRTICNYTYNEVDYK